MQRPASRAQFCGRGQLVVQFLEDRNPSAQRIHEFWIVFAELLRIQGNAVNHLCLDIAGQELLDFFFPGHGITSPLVRWRELFQLFEPVVGVFSDIDFVHTAAEYTCTILG